MSQVPARTSRRIAELLRAMLGGVSPNMRGVWLDDVGPTEVGIAFVLTEDDESDREEIDDMVCEFEAMQDTGIKVALEVVVTDRKLSELALGGEIVFARWEPGGPG